MSVYKKKRLNVYISNEYDIYKKTFEKKTIKLNNKYLKSLIFFFQKTIRNPTDKLDKK
jgi:hypothetical protein